MCAKAVYACSCAYWLDPETEFLRADAVVVARVESIDEHSGCGCSAATSVASVEVEEAFKGAHVGDRIDVELAGAHNCRLDLVAGDKLLLFIDDSYAISLCSPHLDLRSDDTFRYCHPVADTADTIFGSTCEWMEMTQADLLSLLRDL